MSRCKFEQFIVELQIRPVKTIAMPRSNEIQFQIQTWIGPFWYCINYLESSILYMSHPLHWYEVGILWITRDTSEKYQNWALFASSRTQIIYVRWKKIKFDSSRYLKWSDYVQYILWINSQSLEDTQVRYILQKYTLERALHYIPQLMWGSVSMTIAM